MPRHDTILEPNNFSLDGLAVYAVSRRGVGRSQQYVLPWETADKK